MSAENIIGLYERHAAAFDAQRGRALMERAWLDRFTATIPPGGAVLIEVPPGVIGSVSAIGSAAGPTAVVFTPARVQA